MKSQNYDSMVREFETKLTDIIDQDQKPFPRLQNTLVFIRTKLEELKTGIIKQPFEDKQEEIIFFKQVKPLLYSQFIFEAFRFGLFNALPIGTRKTLTKYYSNELKTIRQFYKHNQAHYQYFKLRLTELDEQYFLRSSNIVLPVSEVQLGDPDFDTPMDYLFSKFMAFEQLEQLIIDQMTNLTIAKNQVMSDPTLNKKIKLQWTGESLNLAELAYGIWLTGQVNNGNATILEITQFLEEKFEIKVGRPYRRWTEITRRKKVNPTKYIDQLRAAVHKRINNELELKSGKPK